MFFKAGIDKERSDTVLNVAYNMDCMDGMKQCPDKYFDLAVVDPPYGGGCSQTVQVERERERDCAEDRQTLNNENDHDSVRGLTATISTTRTGGGWFKRKYAPE